MTSMCPDIACSLQAISSEELGFREQQHLYNFCIPLRWQQAEADGHVHELHWPEVVPSCVVDYGWTVPDCADDAARPVVQRVQAVIEAEEQPSAQIEVGCPSHLGGRSGVYMTRY